MTRTADFTWQRSSRVSENPCLIEVLCKNVRQSGIYLDSYSNCVGARASGVGVASLRHDFLTAGVGVTALLSRLPVGVFDWLSLPVGAVALPRVTGIATCSINGVAPSVAVFSLPAVAVTSVVTVAVRVVGQASWFMEDDVGWSALPLWVICLDWLSSITAAASCSTVAGVALTARSMSLAAVDMSVAVSALCRMRAVAPM